MKTVAYVRVSTDTQDVTHQRLAILEFARMERLAVDAFLEVQASSRRSGTVRQLDVLLGSLEPGDALIVSELSRLGRSVGEIITLVDSLMQHQVRVFALKEGLRLTGVHDLQSRVMVTLFSLFAEIEQALLSLRTKEALAAARSPREIQAGRERARDSNFIGAAGLEGLDC
jgi:DNA invertase Pin-like site-specific DNA recombinase